MTPVDAICFDLDSTLCMSNQSDADIHEAVFDRAGVEPLLTPADLRAVDPGDVESAHSPGEFYTNLYRATVDRLPDDVDPDSGLLTELGDITTDVVDATDVSFRAGAEAALEYARAEFDAVGLITNGGEERQRAKLETLGIGDAFDVEVFGDPAGGVEPKPASEPFETALAELGTAAPSTVYVGDTHSTDVVGAHRVGLQSVWVPPDRPHEDVATDPEPAPSYRLESLEELPNVLTP